MKDVLTIILGGGKGTRLYPLTKDRAKPACPFGGKYRLVDIPISNSINSGFRRIYALTQFNSASLHLHIGRTYNFEPFSQDFCEILAAEQTFHHEGWYGGTADAVRKNLEHFRVQKPSYYIILSGDQLYQMDLKEYMRQHVQSGAEVTIAATPVNRSAACGLGILRMDAGNRVDAFLEKPSPDRAIDEYCLPSNKLTNEEKQNDRVYLASMGIYIFNANVMEAVLESDHKDFGKEIIPQTIGDVDVRGYLYRGYWEDIGTIRSFYEANLDLGSPCPRFNLYDQSNPLFTHRRDLPPTKINASTLKNSIASEGSIITNPDMLHCGILPNHTKWIEFFCNLKYIVLDELHIYTGVFGSHLANLMRRLIRVCKFYGSKPLIIAASATIANPRELAEALVGCPFELVDANGAPAGEKHLILYNPPLVDRVQGIRRGIVLESQNLALRLLKAGIKTIVFARSRINAELICGYINDSLANVFNDNQRIRVESYRGGYLPNERRGIEKGLREGFIQGVITTNALELGIDIGGLDASILAGFPSSIASAWQRAGRAGRSGEISLAIMVGSSSPTDQYLVRHPQYFLSRSPESAFVDPSNLYITSDHLKCAAFELPFEQGEAFGSDPSDLLAYLEEQGVLRHSSGRWFWSDRSYPSEAVSLRGGDGQNVVIIDQTKGRNLVIGEMDAHSAREMLHNEAIYLHRGEQYQVKLLELEKHHAYVESSQVNYYTDTIVKSDIKVLSEDRRRVLFGVEERFGDLLIRSEVAKFKKIRFGTHENIGYGDIHLPEYEMHTRGVFLAFVPQSAAFNAYQQIPEKLKAPVISRTATLLRALAPVFLLCRPGDLGVAGRILDPHHRASGIYVYDNFSGGIGLSESLPDRLEELIRAAFDLISACPCTQGCPSCVGALDVRDVLEGNPKAVTRTFLKSWIGSALKS